MGILRSTFFLLFLFSLTIPLLNAFDPEDPYWQQRATNAKKHNENSFHPNPHEVNGELNREVHKVMSNDSLRRNLQSADPSIGPCIATNPIDKCWRCDPNWVQNRKKLASCVLGFGRNTVGGKDGEFYEVTDPSDDDVANPKPGTLRHAATLDKPTWITFAHDMTIKLKQELIMTSDKTIDGRGADVHIAGGAQITIQFIKNIIIHNVKIHDNVVTSGGIIKDSENHLGKRAASDGDGISIFGSSNIWVDHVSFSNCKDGLFDAVAGSTAITVSNNLLTNHNDVMLFGANNTAKEDDIMQITVAFNHYGEGLIQRMPRVRRGFVHVVNNDYTQWQMYAIGGSANPTIISQGNRFVAPPNKAAKEVTKRDGAPESEWKNWIWRSEGDLLENGAFFVQSGSPVNDPKLDDGIKPMPGTSVADITRFSGALKCIAGQPC